MKYFEVHLSVIRDNQLHLVFANNKTLAGALYMLAQEFENNGIILTQDEKDKARILEKEIGVSIYHKMSFTTNTKPS